MIGPEFPAVLAAAAAGDEHAFGRLWHDLQPRLLRYFAVAAPAVAEDLPVNGLTEQAAPDDPAADALEGVSTRAALAQVAMLPPDQAEAIVLRVVAGLEVQRVAELMGKRPGTVRVLTHRGLRRLAERLGADGPTRRVV